jgi:hypothetical protein
MRYAEMGLWVWEVDFWGVYFSLSFPRASLGVFVRSFSEASNWVTVGIGLGLFEIGIAFPKKYPLEWNIDGEGGQHG